ncbi:unnamed protein product [Linum trigynum]|uniref:Uncharacterized protein n=1 Tax=Linum trigynum TaxID=586398 RepID=A0AAV2G3C3_9ROSI
MTCQLPNSLLPTRSEAICFWLQQVVDMNGRKPPLHRCHRRPTRRRRIVSMRAEVKEITRRSGRARSLAAPPSTFSSTSSKPVAGEIPGMAAVSRDWELLQQINPSNPLDSKKLRLLSSPRDPSQFRSLDSPPFAGSSEQI